MLLTTVLVVLKHVQSMSPLVIPVRRCGISASRYESYTLAAHSELPYSTQWNVPKPLGKLGPPGPTVVQSYNIRAIRILIAIAAFYDYEIWQIDAKTVFLNGHLSPSVPQEAPYNA
ncbi:hypothetical protein Tco_1525056 [Tanacetum coccineum]